VCTSPARLLLVNPFGPPSAIDEVLPSSLSGRTAATGETVVKNQSHPPPDEDEPESEELELDEHDDDELESDGV
jgi:hypothetical protein